MSLETTAIRIEAIAEHAEARAAECQRIEERSCRLTGAAAYRHAAQMVRDDKPESLDETIRDALAQRTDDLAACRVERDEARIRANASDAALDEARARIVVLQSLVPTDEDLAEQARIRKLVHDLGNRCQAAEMALAALVECRDPEAVGALIAEARAVLAAR